MANKDFIGKEFNYMAAIETIEQGTESDYVDQEINSEEEEYMDKVENIIQIIERLEDLKR